MNTRFFLVLTGLVMGCGGSYPEAQQPTGGLAATDPTHQQPGAAPTIDITHAALPYRVLRARGGSEISAADFYIELGQAQAICLGESHPNPHHHWAQLHMLDELSKRASGAAMALGFEMFQRPFQGVLDDYARKLIDDAALMQRTGWAERWGYDFALYQPMVALAAERGMALLALNIAKELRKKVVDNGMDKLTATERAEVPEIDLTDTEHRAWFDGIMAEMGGIEAHGSAHGAGDAGGDEAAKRADRIYLSQVLWDETMADTAARWLAGAAGRHVIILAGNGHCHDGGIVRRMHRRGAAKVVSVLPIIDDGQGNVASELAQPMTDYLFVMSVPSSAQPVTPPHPAK